MKTDPNHCAAVVAAIAGGQAALFIDALHPQRLCLCASGPLCICAAAGTMSSLVSYESACSIDGFTWRTAHESAAGHSGLLLSHLYLHQLWLCALAGRPAQADAAGPGHAVRGTADTLRCAICRFHWPGADQLLGHNGPLLHHHGHIAALLLFLGQVLWPHTSVPLCEYFVVYLAKFSLRLWHW